MGHAPRPAERLSAKEHPPPEEGQREGAGREDLAGKLATRRHRRSASGLRAPRL